MRDKPEAVSIREAQPDDAAAMSQVLREIIAVTGRDRPSDLAFVRARYLDDPGRVRCSVAVDTAGIVLGFQSLNRAEPGNMYGVSPGWGIIGTHISPRAHRRGVGSALFRASHHAARAAGLTKIDAYIAADTPGALGYYEAMGFRTYRSDSTIVQKAFVLDDSPPCSAAP